MTITINLKTSSFHM